MSNEIRTNARRGGMLPLQPSLPRNDEQLQIDIGDYVIFSGDTKVGEVFVEADPAHPNDPAYYIEHWCLLGTYDAPSPDRVEVGLRFKYGGGAHGSARDFLAYVRTLSGARYIKAQCHEQVM